MLLIIFQALNISAVFAENFECRIENTNVYLNNNQLTKLTAGNLSIEANIFANIDMTSYVFVILCKTVGDSYIIENATYNESIFTAGTSEKILFNIRVDNAEGRFIKVFMWDSKSTGRLVAQPAVFPSNANESFVSIKNSKSEYQYNIINGIQTGSKVYLDDTCTFSSFGYSQLEGATYIQTAMSEYSNNLNKSKTLNWLTLEIRDSIEMYILTSQKSNLASGYLWWVDSWGSLVEDSKGNPITITDSNGTDLYLYRRLYILDMGESEIIEIPSLGDFGRRMYSVAIKKPDMDTTLKSMSVNGIQISTFEPFEMGCKIELPPKTTSITEVTYVPYSENAVVSVQYPQELPGDIVVTVTSPAGKVRTYTLSCKIGKPSVKITYKGSTNTYNIVPNFTTGEFTFSDRAFKLEGIDDSVLSGAIYIQTAVSDRSNPTNRDPHTEKWLEIELNSSAEVYVLSRPVPSAIIMKWLLNPEWEQVRNNGEPVIMKSWTGEWHDLFYLYKKTVYIEDGPPQKVVFGSSGDSNSMYSVAVKWLD